MAAFDAKTGAPLWQFNVTGPRLGGRVPHHHARRRAAPARHRPPSARRGEGARRRLEVRRRVHLCHAGGRRGAPAAHLRHRQPVAPDGRCLPARRQPLHLVARGARPPHRDDSCGTTSRCRTTAGATTWRARRCCSTCRRAASGIPAVAHATKTGWVYVHDRRTARCCSSRSRSCRSGTSSRPPQPGDGRGGRARHRRRGQLVAVGVRPSRQLFFVGALHLPTRYIAHEVEAARRQRDSSTRARRTPTRRGAPSRALDLADGGRVRWQVKTGGAAHRRRAGDRRRADVHRRGQGTASRPSPPPPAGSSGPGRARRA